MIVIIQSERSSDTATLKEELCGMKSKISELEREIGSATKEHHSETTNEGEEGHRGRY